MINQISRKHYFIVYIPYDIASALRAVECILLLGVQMSQGSTSAHRGPPKVFNEWIAH